MSARIKQQGLLVADALFRFVEDEVLPAIGVASARFWQGFDAIVHDLAPKNLALLAERDRLQALLDEWHRAHPGPIADMPAYRRFLEGIGYLQPRPVGTKASTANVDAELAIQAGPQLVVPLLNARYALNAANARWGSLYDALYGTDAIPEADGATRTGGFNPQRGAAVIAYTKAFLERCAPLAAAASHAEVQRYSVRDGRLIAVLSGGAATGLKDPAKFVGYQGGAETPSAVLLRNHGLHVDIRIDRTTPIGASDTAGVSDVVLEAALSTILDLEDSVVAVDAGDKVLGYRNWLGILQGTLTEIVTKGGKSIVRGLNPDRLYTAPDGGELRLHGRSLLFVRNVGHLMTNPAILYGAA